MQFLMGLDDQFSSMRSKILSMDPLPSLNKVFALILQDEKQKEVVAKKQQNFDAAAFSGRMIHSSPRATSFNQFQKRDKPVCSHCGMIGHLKIKCYKLVGYPPGHRLAKGKPPVVNAAGSMSYNSSSNIISSLSDITITPSQCQQILAMLTPQLKGKIPNGNEQSHVVISSSSQVPEASAFSGNRACFSDSIVAHKWILDTGASEHMVCSIKHLVTVNTTIKATVKLPNGDTAIATHVGTVKLFDTFILTNVLVVPCF